jgi:hypothetical protein
LGKKKKKAKPKKNRKKMGGCVGALYAKSWAGDR